MPTTTTQLPHDQQHNFPIHHRRAITEDSVPCRLFGDKITLEVCMLRKRELDGRGGFSCADCTTNKS